MKKLLKRVFLWTAVLLAFAAVLYLCCRFELVAIGVSVFLIKFISDC